MGAFQGFPKNIFSKYQWNPRPEDYQLKSTTRDQNMVTAVKRWISYEVGDGSSVGAVVFRCWTADLFLRTMYSGQKHTLLFSSDNPSLTHQFFPLTEIDTNSRYSSKYLWFFALINKQESIFSFRLTLVDKLDGVKIQGGWEGYVQLILNRIYFN